MRLNPYLVREVRLISLTAALKPLSCLQLESRTARNAAFLVAGLADVTDDEHRQAAWRARLRIRLFGAPAVPSAPAAIAVPGDAPQLARVA